MSNPFRIAGPALISFSGGRTSALMLRRAMDEGLGPDVHVVFANTGKEREGTLNFVQDVSERWGVRVVWVERYRPDPAAPASFREVSFLTASRRGEPFDALIAERKFLPNPVMRFCTQELKIRVMKAWMLARGYESWTNVVGLRADEPHRVAKQRAKESRERWGLAFPLFDAGVTKNDVLLFWKKQPFDLQLRSWEGNCDLCFLKGVRKRSRILEDSPHLAPWWAGHEAAGPTFRADTPRYAALLEQTQRQVRMFPNSLFDEAQLEDDPTDLDECAGYCEAA